MEMSKMEGTDGVVDADPGLDIDLFQEQICELLGLPLGIPKNKVIEQLVGALYPNTPENQEGINFMLAHVASHNPRSLLEAQLLVELLACHQLCTRMLHRASIEKWPENIEKFVNITAKLSRGFRNGMETLVKYKRGGSNTST